MSTGTKKRGGFLRAIGWLLAICVVLELGLRLFGYGSFTIYRPDNQLLWVPEPGRTLTVVNHLPITINHQGFRYATDLQPKQKDQFRVIAFGDSNLTQGWAVDDNSPLQRPTRKNARCERLRPGTFSGCFRGRERLSEFAG